MDDYCIVDSFEIDDGSLEGVSPVQCFVLGVEWYMVYLKLIDESGPERFDVTVNSLNANRLIKVANKYRWMSRISNIPESEFSDLTFVRK